MTRAYKDVLSEIVAYIETHGTESAARNARTIAVSMLLHAEPRNGRVYLEIDKRYTKDGHPLPVSFETYDEER